MRLTPKTLLDRLEDRDRMSSCGGIGAIGPSIFRQTIDTINGLNKTVGELIAENTRLRAQVAELEGAVPASDAKETD